MAKTLEIPRAETEDGIAPLVGSMNAHEIPGFFIAPDVVADMLGGVSLEDLHAGGENTHGGICGSFYKRVFMLDLGWQIGLDISRLYTGATGVIGRRHAIRGSRHIDAGSIGGSIHLNVSCRPRRVELNLARIVVGTNKYGRGLTDSSGYTLHTGLSKPGTATCFFGGDSIDPEPKPVRTEHLFVPPRTGKAKWIRIARTQRDFK